MVRSLFGIRESASFGGAVAMAVVDEAGVDKGSEVEDSIKTMEISNMSGLYLKVSLCAGPRFTKAQSALST